MSPPSCSTMRVEMACPPQCTGSSWSVSLAVVDRGRSGLASLQLSQGQGTLTLLHTDSPGDPGFSMLEKQPVPNQHHTDREKKTSEQRQEGPRLKQGDAPLNVSEWAGGLSQPLWVRYTSSCCSPQAELLVWDGAGNTRRCHLTSRQQRGLRERSGVANGTGETPFISCILLLLSFLCRSIANISL